MTLRALSLLWVSSMVLSACECEASFAACKEVRVSDLVFTGTVESIEPIFLNRWYGTDQSAMRSLNEPLFTPRSTPRPNPSQVKDTFLATFPGMDDREKKQVQAADTVQQMASMFYSSLDRGMRVHLKVATLFKQGDDDDDAGHKARKMPIFWMSGPHQAIAVMISRSARPIWFMRTTKRARIISSPAVACGRSGYRTREKISLISISTRTSPRHRPGSKDSSPAIGRASLLLIRCTSQLR